MRILHTSDWHLGKTLMERSLLDDQAQLLDQIAAALRAEAYDLVVIAGDIFDRGVPPEAAVTLLGRWLAAIRAEHPSLPLVFIAGNHDSGARLAWAAGLLELAHVHLRGAVTTLETPIAFTTASGEAVEVWAIPFLWPEAHGSEVRTQVEMLEIAVANILERRDPSRVQIAVAHCFTQGGRFSDSERALVGQATLIDPAVFGDFDYVALGHLHRPQRVAANAWYSGSLAAYSFSEASDAEGVLRVVAGRGRAAEVTPVPLRAPRPISSLEGELDELLTNAHYAEYAEHYLSVRLTRPVHAGQPMARLRRRFPYLLQLLNPAVDAPVAAAPAIGRGEHRDVHDDFVDFFHHVYPHRGPTPEITEAFAALRGTREHA